MARLEINFRFGPNTGHSSADVRILPDYVCSSLRSGHSRDLG
jgi:hypothetical protein